MKTGLTLKEVGDLVRKELQKHQPTGFQLRLECVEKFEKGWWRALVRPTPEDVRTRSYVTNLTDVEDVLKDKHQVNVVLVPVLVQAKSRSTLMAYGDKVLDHYNHPRNVGTLDRNSDRVGTGIVGAPECGDVMRLQIEVDDQERIVDAKFKTFGCGSAIASSSLATEWIKGKTLDEALDVRNTDIVRELALPPVKIHCSVLAEDAIKAAIHDLKQKLESKKEAAPAAATTA